MPSPIRWRTCAGLIAFGVLVGALAGEAVARLVGFEFRPHMRNRVYFAEPDALLGWRNRPGLAGPYGGEAVVDGLVHGERVEPYAEQCLTHRHSLGLGLRGHLPIPPSQAKSIQPSTQQIVRPTGHESPLRRSRTTPAT